MYSTTIAICRENIWACLVGAWIGRLKTGIVVVGGDKNYGEGWEWGQNSLPCHSLLGRCRLFHWLKFEMLENELTLATGTKLCQSRIRKDKHIRQTAAAVQHTEDPHY